MPPPPPPPQLGMAEGKDKAALLCESTGVGSPGRDRELIAPGLAGTLGGFFATLSWGAWLLLTLLIRLHHIDEFHHATAGDMSPKRKT